MISKLSSHSVNFRQVLSGFCKQLVIDAKIKSEFEGI